MLRTSAFVAALLVGWGWSCCVLSEDKPPVRGALPPSVGDSLRDEKIEDVLLQPCSLDIDESSLQDAADYLHQKFDIEVKLDLRSLADAAVDPSVLITFHVKDVPLASALDLLLDDLDLAYVVQHGVLKIMSREKADGVLMTRVYPVEDFVTATLDGHPPYLPRAKNNTNYSALVQMVEDTIAPDSWDTNSGIGSIRPFRAPGGPALVISNTRQVHHQIATLFADLRAMKQLPGVGAQNARRLGLDID